jgi:hypothetical protein
METSPNETSAPDAIADLKKSLQDLKRRIDEERRRNEMPINESLGNPKQDAENADGRNDLPDSDDD